MKTMIYIGDSLTAATDIPVGHAWPALVTNNLNRTVINRGIGGDTTAGMLALFFPDVVADKPAFVFIMGGTNDLWWGWEVNLCEKLRAHASENEVLLVDLQQPFLASDQQVRANLFLPDGLHPNLSGQDVIAKMICIQCRKHFNF
jgi:lysophospholipase L1-like esterase